MIDSSMNLSKLRQKGEKLEKIQQISLSLMDGLKFDLESISTFKDSAVSISDRCVTVRGNHYIYDTGHKSTVKLNSDLWSFHSSETIIGTNL